jgi:predicted ATPase
VAEGARTLIVVNFRPEYHAGWMQKSYYQQMPLLPLGSEAIAELLRDLLGTDPSVTSLGSRIRERTGGNPFFIEEIVQALAEAANLEGTKGAYRLVRPVAELALPTTVQAVLAARVDRLEEREKHVLQGAAVIGRNFTEPILRRVVELPETELARALDKLTAAEFIYEQALYPKPEYMFKHALTQEVPYHSVLIERRKTLHERAAQAIETLFAESLEAHYGELAHHYRLSGNTEKAVEYLHLAGEQAGERSANAEAVSNLTTAPRVAFYLAGHDRARPKGGHPTDDAGWGAGCLQGLWRSGEGTSPRASARSLSAAGRKPPARSGAVEPLPGLR